LIHLSVIPVRAGVHHITFRDRSDRRGNRIPCRLALLVGSVVLAVAFPFGHLRAQPGVTVAMVGSPNMTLKHNDPCALASPRAMYVSYRVTNTSGGPLSNLSATISGFANGIALSGGQAATQFVGSLPSGGVRTLYWYVQYPCTFGVSATLTVSVSSGGTPATGSGTFTTRAMQATGTGGQLQSALLGAGAVVGQTISYDVEYTFGNTQGGDEFDHQPAGNVGFDAACFQLTGTLIVSSASTAVVTGTVNRTYFVATASQGGSGHAVVVRYFFRYLCAGVTSVNRPYANQTSGATNLKYSSNFDTFIGPTLPIATNPFSTTKSASPRQLPAGGNVTYTVVLANPSSFEATADSIVDLLPAGVAFSGIGAGSDVTAANSGSVPSPGSTGRIVFRGNPGSSYTIPPDGSLTLVYTATVSSTPGLYVNAAEGYAGSTSIGADADTVVVGSADLSVAKTGPDSVVVSDTVTYVLVTTNAGPATAFGVVVRDSLPEGVALVAASRGATSAGGVVTWPTVATLAPGAELTDTVRVVAPAVLATLLNVGRAAAATFDPDPANNDGSAAESRVLSEVIGSIVVTPDGLPSPMARLPGSYAQLFTVHHRGGADGSFDLLGGARGASGLLTIDSIRGPAASAPAQDSARLTLPARSELEYTVWYTVAVGDTATGATRLLARSVPTPLLADSGWAELRRTFPSLALTKLVSPAGVLAPGAALQYEIGFSNVGGYEAEDVRVAEEVPAAVFLAVGSPSAALPAGITATVEYSADGGVTWDYAPASGACGAPAGHDGCVDRLRWSLAGVLPAGPALSTGTLTYEALIR
jgi:uncharacterized repeat protein (TIGR01451 family)